MQHPPRRLRTLVSLLLCGALWSAPASGQTAPQAAVRDDDEILVRFSQDVSIAQARRDLEAAGMEPTSYFAALRLHRCRIVNDQDVPQAVRACQAHPDVEFVEPNYIYSSFALPNDTRFGEQWSLRNDDNVDIDAVEAWEIETGVRHIVIAVVDTGVDPTHPDLRDNLWHNPGESGDGRETNGIDDDHNGYVDDVLGWDFVDGAPGVRDENGHGTHVAGIIAARGDNETGISGVCWHASIMSVRFLDRDGMGRASDAIAAILYAASNGARILNASWGGPGRSQALQEALEYARQHKLLVIAAAGNSSLDNDRVPIYPASYALDNILSVAATDRQDHLAAFSNFGRQQVDLAAPGTDILSTFPEQTYRTLSGTSMAAPHVSGVAALVAAHYPAVTFRQVMIRVVGGAEPLNSLSGKVHSGARLNAYGALSSYPRVAFVEQLGAGAQAPGTLIQAEVTDEDPVHAVSLHFRVDGGESHILPMQAQGSDVYRGLIPLSKPGSMVEYFVRGVDVDGNSGLSTIHRFLAGE